ncbi:MAG: UDP-N-acetylmuramoyl-tripeptide--D-alanyl-D-alanine ligase [Oscillospiraceae bacterium]
MTGITVSDIARLTGGKLINGGGERRVSGVVIDSRLVRDGFAFAALPGERADGHDYISKAFELGAACCIALRVPSGETRPLVIVSEVAEALASLAEGYRKTLELPLIAVTGSVGKTTTKEMLAAVLSRRFNTLKTEKNLNNELGVPLTLFRIDASHEAAVVELGISHFGEMTRLAQMARPTMAVFTVIGRAHLEFLGDRDGVLRAKGELLDCMAKDAAVLVNGDDDKLSALCCTQKKITFGLGASCDVRAEDLVSDGVSTSCDIICGERRLRVRIPAFGQHMVYAALAAAAVGMRLGMSDAELAEGIAAYSTVGRRASVVDTGSLTLIDDCYNANPDSVASAVRSASALGGRLVCILGDMLELGENTAELHKKTGELALSKGALLLTVGELSKNMGGLSFDTKSELISALPRLLKKGDRVLVKASHSMAFEEISDAIKGLSL